MMVVGGGDAPGTPAISPPPVVVMVVGAVAPLLVRLPPTLWPLLVLSPIPLRAPTLLSMSNTVPCCSTSWCADDDDDDGSGDGNGDEEDGDDISRTSA